MSYTSWRGVVGCIKPTHRPGSLEELIRMLPEGIGVIPLFLDIRAGTTDEFKRSVEPFVPLIEQLVNDDKVDLIHAEGAPPFMLLGYKGEAELIRKWEKKYKTPIFTAGQNHIAAMKALKVKNFVGATYFSGAINKTFADYFTDAGFKVKGMAGIDVPFEKVQELPAEMIYAHIKREFLKAKGGDAIYMLGSGWRTLNIIDTLEQDLGVPVIHPVTARVWEIQKRLHVHEPREGYGFMLAELP